MSSVGALTRGPTCSMFLIVFRTCKLSNSNFTMASVDILYIDITRRWSGSTPDSREAGNTHTHTQTHTPTQTFCEKQNTHKETACRGQRAGYPWDSEQNNVLGDNCMSFFVRFPLTLCFRNWNELRSQCDSEREYPTWIIQTLHLSRGVFARRSGWMEITWTRMEGPVRRRLWAEFRMSSYVFRQTEVGVCYFCVCVRGRICTETRKDVELLLTKLSLERGGKVSRGHVKECM